MNIFELIEQYDPGCDIRGNRENLCQAKGTSLPWGGHSGSICLALNREYLGKALDNPNICAIIVTPEVPLPEDLGQKIILVSQYAEALFYQLHLFGLHNATGDPEYFVERHIAASARIHSTAVVAEHVHIGENVVVGPYACIGDNTFIGDDSHIGPHVVIGEDGLYPRMLNGKKIHMTHWGGVRIGSNCRIGAQCIIAKSEYYRELTCLKDDVFLGFQVTIGHNCTVEKGSTISSHATLGGRASVGSECWIGIGATISNTITIGDQASIKLGSVVIDNVNPKASVSGNFAIDHFRNLRNKAKA
jgi:UDP-3-O-[3-hydroxymyristoyl] glucosamine N-acyltransferase